MRSRQRINHQRRDVDPQRLVQVCRRPSGDVQRLGGCGEPISLLVDAVALVVPGKQAVTGLHCYLHTAGKRVEVRPEMRLNRRDWVVAEQPFVGVMEKFTERLAAGQRLQRPEFLPEY